MRRTGSASWTSPTCRPGPGWCSSRSCRTCSAAASWAGAPLPECRRNCRWARSRWRCGSASATARQSPASSSRAMWAIHRDSLRRGPRRSQHQCLDRDRRRQRSPGQVSHRSVQEYVRQARRTVPHRQGPRTGEAVVGLLVQPQPAALIDRLRHADRAREVVPPADQPRAAADTGRNRPSIYRGRCTDLANRSMGTMSYPLGGYDTMSSALV